MSDFGAMWKGLLVALLSGCGPAERLAIVVDECPRADQKAFPGECGCDIPDERCVPLKRALVHRYAFDGSGTVAVDDVGGADGEIHHAELSGTGRLELDRDAELEQYVELPHGIISALGSATFEAWVIWTAPPQDQPFWERIFDFGVSTAGRGERDQGQSYLFLAPGQPGTVPTKPRTAYQRLISEGETRVDGGEPFPVDVPTHVAVVVDADAQELRLYIEGRAQGASPLLEPLSAIEDMNNWLGRSQYAADTQFGGAFLEFRVYEEALSEAQLDDSRAFGPSPGFLPQNASGSP